MFCGVFWPCVTIAARIAVHELCTGNSDALVICALKKTKKVNQNRGSGYTRTDIGLSGNWNERCASEYQYFVSG